MPLAVSFSLHRLSLGTLLFRQLLLVVMSVMHEEDRMYSIQVIGCAVDCSNFSTQHKIVDNYD